MRDRRMGAAAVALGLAACVPEDSQPGSGPTAQITDETSPGGSPGAGAALDAQ